MAYELTTDVIIAPLPLTERGWGIHLGGTLKKVPRLLYSNQNLVIQRELGNMNKCRINSEHANKVNVAKFSPNGEWICSGDDHGDCIVWAHESFVVKQKFEVGKKVTDICWGDEGQKIFAVGDGKEDKAKVVPWNTNNKLGEISGAQKGYLACDFKPNRPYRLIASGEDYSVYFYAGTPFKFETYDKSHKNYVNCVRYSNDGNYFLSCSSDKKLLLFDGKDGKKLKEIDSSNIENGHKGTIYELSWSPDNKKFITCSADKTCKIWDFNQMNIIKTFNMDDGNNSIGDMQISCLWLSNDYILSISLNGKINFFKDDGKEDQVENDEKKANDNKPYQTITGHRKSIQDICVDRKNQYIYTCDSDSRIIRCNRKSNFLCQDIIGNPHNGAIIKYIRLSYDQNILYSIAADDTLVATNVNVQENILFGNCITNITGAARMFCVTNTKQYALFIGTHKSQIFIYHYNEETNQMDLKNTLDIDYIPSCGIINHLDNILAIGVSEKNVHSIYIYEINKTMDNIKLLTKISNQYLRNEILDLAFSYDHQYLASCDRNRHIWIWNISNGFNNINEPINKGDSYQFHNAIPSSIEWSLDSKMLVSCAHDNNIYIWLAVTQGKSDNIHLDNAFHGAIRRVSFLDDNYLVGASADCTTRFFNFKKTK